MAWFGLESMAPATEAVYPSRPVRWIVPYTAGGATDVLSRLICQRLSDRLGQSFVVENKPGAGSNIGTQTVINSPPDGYTLLLTSTANAINASFDPSLPYDFAKGIVPVAGVARIPLVLVVVLAVSGLIVMRLHKVFGSQDLNANAGAGIEIVQFNPKIVVYDVFGPAGTTAKIDYYDADANTHEVNTALPWSTKISTTLPAVSANIMVQGDSDHIGCRITVDGTVRDEKSTNGVNAQTFCLVKSA